MSYHPKRWVLVIASLALFATGLSAQDMNPGNNGKPSGDEKKPLIFNIKTNMGAVEIRWGFIFQNP